MINKPWIKRAQSLSALCMDTELKPNEPNEYVGKSLHTDPCENRGKHFWNQKRIVNSF